MTNWGNITFGKFALEITTNRLKFEKYISGTEVSRNGLLVLKW